MLKFGQPLQCTLDALMYDQQFTKFHEYQEDKRPQAPRRHITELLKGYPCVPANIYISTLCIASNYFEEFHRISRKKVH